MSIYNQGADQFSGEGYTIFNDASSAAGASILNRPCSGPQNGGVLPGATIFNGTSTAGHATITNDGVSFSGGSAGYTSFNDSSTAGSATLIAEHGGVPMLLAVRLFFTVLRVQPTQSLSLMEGEAAAVLFLTMLRRAAPRGWRFLTMVTWTLAGADRA